LKDFPKNDYPTLNTFPFASCWIGFGMDKSLVIMRDLITRGIKVAENGRITPTAYRTNNKGDRFSRKSYFIDPNQVCS